MTERSTTEEIAFLVELDVLLVPCQTKMLANPMTSETMKQKMADIIAEVESATKARYPQR